MKKYFILFLLVPVYLFSQENKGIVYYGFVDAMATGNGNGLDYNAYMTFNKEQSYYVTAKDSLEKTENLNVQKNTEKNDENIIYNGLKSSPLGDQVVFYKKSNLIYSSFEYGEVYYVKENATKHNWKIHKETKKIGKYTCTKATMFFRGRDYTVWFTFAIPVSYGPWKLNGLPGLILEAYDTDKNLYWYFKSIEYPTNNKQKVNNLRVPLKEKYTHFITIEEFGKKLVKYIDKVYEDSVLTAKKHNTYIPKRSEMPTILELFMEEIK